jgi:hypothetical protein
MSVGVRLLLVLLGLLMVAAGVLCLALGFDLVPEPGLGTSLMVLAGAPVVAAVGGGLILFGVILLALGFRSTKKPAPETVLQTSEHGEVRIAIIAIENMVLRVVQQTQGVKDGGRRVYSSPEGLVVQIKIRVMPDLELPGLITELQEKVKGYLEQVTGIVVHEVKVLVENIILDQVPAKRILRPS